MDQDLKNSIVQTGTTIIGIVCKNGVIMASDKQASAGSMVMSKYEQKIYPVKDYLLVSGCGMAAEIQRIPKYLSAELRLKEIHLYDGLRADRATSYHGLELRVPFLDYEFVDMYMKISEKIRIPTEERMEKYLLRKAFENDNLLPTEVLWRKKEAFSDGVSSKEESWHDTIKKYIDGKITDKEFNDNKDKYNHCKPETKEAYYYRKVFCEQFSDKNADVIPKYWLPNWCDGLKEPSARALDVYNS